jgi:CheY-like chemotaxis protein
MPSTDPPTGSAARPPGTRRLLFVEDDWDQIASLRLILAHPSVVIEHAANGVEAISRARANPPDAFLLDVQIPAMDGFEVFNVLRRDPAFASCRIIFYSGYAPRGSLELAREAGAFACLRKPCPPEVLRTTVLRALRVDEVAPEPPLSKPAGRAPRPASPAGEPRPRSPNGRAPQVAIVGDDPSLYTAAAGVIREALGEDAVIASYAGGVAAFRAFCADAPDIAILDLKLPDIDGLSLLKIMKREPRTSDVAVIIVTTSGHWEMLAIALDAGAEAHIAKPIDRNILSGLLRQIRHVRRARTEAAPPPVESRERGA